MKNHINIDGQLLQTNKKWSSLKENQKQKIMNWLCEETAAYYQIHLQYPMGRYSEDVVDNVYDKIQAAEIWIPYGEVYQHYTSKKQHIINSLEKSRSQKKLYLDMTDTELAGTAILIKGTEIIPAGTTVYSMPVSDKNSEYDHLASEQDIHFIFDDSVPEIAFYTIPHIAIFAYDSKGGLLGTVNGITDIECDKQIVYIDTERRCYVAGQTLKHFLSRGKNWCGSMKMWKKIHFFASAEEAKSQLPFVHARNNDSVFEI